MNAQYVYTIKSNANNKGRTVRVKKGGTKIRIFRGARSAADAGGPLQSALEFI